MRSTATCLLYSTPARQLVAAAAAVLLLQQQLRLLLFLLLLFLLLIERTGAAGSLPRLHAIQQEHNRPIWRLIKKQGDRLVLGVEPGLSGRTD